MHAKAYIYSCSYLVFSCFGHGRNMKKFPVWIKFWYNQASTYIIILWVLDFVASILWCQIYVQWTLYLKALFKFVPIILCMLFFLRQLISQLVLQLFCKNESSNICNTEILFKIVSI